jgi:hypothetical protein
LRLLNISSFQFQSFVSLFQPSVKESINAIEMSIVIVPTVHSRIIGSLWSGLESPVQRVTYTIFAQAKRMLEKSPQW